ncbi:3-isopropylmalate dehydrogenase LeuB (plasmid) [Cupriavidus necator N-1]|uniref:3-isopropylmalate dehydrogenase n=1 Tax=Cupriavidus necator (strain ATCC 43291 / DSM 13513 / CCUG 52238 / LMG 8453 / N-1) TaxID=1042878 RepID=F8GUQ2_CUPNN|nr:isocitrate/isopropylmalate dehydrogenase family protein [Cupriavidus necator]AEI82456.1 3-isopropylmalate dehydrogenase LeuB [Cupriavidus necator N-1]MDX6007462.1 isocitrate/isopropylmalate dehydrogenase family protein [Cupriavidus necator]
MTSYDIAVLPGDGIGVEVMNAAMEVLRALETRIGSKFTMTVHPAGAQLYSETGNALPDSTLDACRKAHAILFGAMGLPHVRGKDGTEVIPQLDIRFALDLYAGVRPIKTWQGLPVPLRDRRAAEIDLVLVRESTEGLFYARGRGTVEGSGDDSYALDTMKITHKGTARVCDFAFRLAEQRKAAGKRGHVTNVDKANVFTSMAYWRQIFEQRAKDFPSITVENAYVDAMALNLVMKPWQYDVLVTENMFGDILSDLIAALVGGMGMAPSADIGDDHAVFQPAHGTAPDIAGRGIANPSAMLLSAAMMLDWLAVRHDDPALVDGARAIEKALQTSFEKKEVLPFDFGGSSTTADIANAVLRHL